MLAYNQNISLCNVATLIFVLAIKTVEFVILFSVNHHHYLLLDE